ncbi:uncharacterized protein LOC129584467 [Paramacrobiotus metropolitanus]|uniref:uncharacterized protein LOC129584467 n=1 Tax=Paramacrobiotus metropolitanus TaxID=2943436 RepID=UPI002445FAEC|nr:uncharacterized protein LOC129584467 [Paramacrobiotus metropolitanus]XP_055332613.1 uncharacterized protein LOC129584467 [Paramacrobiotus metropolitanus]
MAGVRAFSASLKELRIILCQKGESSKGVRDFLEQFYIPLKQQNPKLPILVRECSGITPKVHARYDYGQENSVDLSGMHKEQVLNTVNTLADAR